MRKSSAPGRLGFPRLRNRSVKWLGLVAISAALVAFGGALSLVIPSLKHAAAAEERLHAGILSVPLDTPLTEHLVYPPGIALGSFDGAYTMATVYKSGVVVGNRVAFWGSEAGALQSRNYPIDEFVYVLEGDVVTVDADGTRHEFHSGDAFVIPKGWVGTWDMKTRFKKIIVNF